MRKPSYDFAAVIIIGAVMPFLVQIAQAWRIFANVNLTSQLAIIVHPVEHIGFIVKLTASVKFVLQPASKEIVGNRIARDSLEIIQRFRILPAMQQVMQRSALGKPRFVLLLR